MLEVVEWKLAKVTTRAKGGQYERLEEYTGNTRENRKLMRTEVKNCYTSESRYLSATEIDDDTRMNADADWETAVELAFATNM